MGESKKRNELSKQEQMIQFQRLANDSRKTNSSTSGENKQKHENNIGKIKLSNVKVRSDLEDITGVVVSPEYLSYLESKASEADSARIGEMRPFVSDFTEMCIKHLLDSGYSIQGSNEEHRVHMQNAIDHASKYSEMVSYQKEFFLKKGGVND